MRNRRPSKRVGCGGWLGVFFIRNPHRLNSTAITIDTRVPQAPLQSIASAVRFSGCQAKVCVTTQMTRAIGFPTIPPASAFFGRALSASDRTPPNIIVNDNVARRMITAMSGCGIFLCPTFKLGKTSIRMAQTEDPFASPSWKHLLLFVLSVALFLTGILVTSRQDHVSMYRVFALSLLGIGLLMAIVRVTVARAHFRKMKQKPNQSPQPTPLKRRG